jgi:hypothetical protein
MILYPYTGGTHVQSRRPSLGLQRRLWFARGWRRRPSGLGEGIAGVASVFLLWQRSRGYPGEETEEDRGGAVGGPRKVRGFCGGAPRVAHQFALAQPQHLRGSPAERAPWAQRGVARCFREVCARGTGRGVPTARYCGSGAEGSASGKRPQGRFRECEGGPCGPGKPRGGSAA